MSETKSLGAGWNALTERSPAARVADINLKGSGQVMFQGSALTGLLFLVGIFYGAIVADSPQVAIGAVIGLVVSSFTAYWLQPDTDTMRAGLTATTAFWSVRRCPPSWRTTAGCGRT